MYFLIFLSFLLCLTSSLSTPTTVRLPSGASVDSSLLLTHLPDDVTPDLYPHLLYEHTSDNYLLSLSARIHIPSVAPRIAIPSVSHTRFLINGVRHYPPRGPTIRRGDRHSFVYDYRSGVLLAAWGPALDLRPLHLEHHPNVMVNVHPSSLKSNNETVTTTTTTLHKMALPYTVARASGDGNAPNEHGHFRPEWKAERPVFFDVGFAFDASFCSKWVNSGENASQVVHASGVEAHQMSLTPIVSVRIGDIVGFCKQPSDIGNTTLDVKWDMFAAPRDKLLACKLNSLSCSRPAIRLESFRNAWNYFINDSLSDAAYLMTADRVSTESNVVGSAWVASACSTFSFGWVLGNHPVVLAHEMGHTLGAPHDSSSENLMKAALDINKAAKYSQKSLHYIEAFLAKLSGQRCMVSRHVGGASRRFIGFTRLLRGPGIEGSDVAAGSRRAHGQIDVAMIYVQKYRGGGSGAALRLTTLYREPAEKNPGFPFSYNTTFNNEYMRHSHYANISAGAGVAIARLKKENKGSEDKEKGDDVIGVFMRKNSPRAYYVVGYDLDARIGILGGFTTPRNVPIAFGSNVIAIGSCAADLRGKGQIDLVIVAVTLDQTTGNYSASVIVGRNVHENGYVYGGWTKTPWSLPWSTSNPVGDISVTAWFPKESETADAPTTPIVPNLLFAHTEQTSTGWKYLVTVTTPTGTHVKSYVPNLSYASSQNTLKLTGGVALVHLLSTVPTSLIFQNRRFASSGSEWLQVGDGLLTKEHAVVLQSAPQLAYALGENIVPVHACPRCYNGKAAISHCERAVTSCFKSRAATSLEKVHSVRSIVNMNTLQRNAWWYYRPKQPSSLFCEGFHSLFVARGSGRCPWDASRTRIIAEGARVELQRDIDAFHGRRRTIQANVDIINGSVPENLRYIANRLGGPLRQPISVQVHLQSNVQARHLRSELVRRAIRKLRRKPDFSTFFSNAWARAMKYSTIRRKWGRTFVVILRFNAKFKAQWLRDSTI